jgi:hypothetical protein
VQFEEKVYEVRIPRPIDDKAEQFDRFAQMLSHRFEEKEENFDNRTLFENETNLFKGSKTYKCLTQKESQMEQTDFTYFSS